MNILLINHYAGSPEKGMEFRPYYLAREWVKLGHTVDIIAADYSHLRRINPIVKKDFQKENIDGINYYWIKTNEYEGNGVKRSLTMGKFISKLWLKAKWIVKNLDPDVVICSSTYPLDTYVGQKIRKLSKKSIKLIHEVHDMWPATLIEIGGMSRRHPFVIAMQIGENSAYRKSDLVVSLLPNAESYMREHGLTKGKFRCIPNGILEEEWEKPLELPKEHKKLFEKLKEEKKFIVGYFGGHALSNALGVLVDVAENIDDKDIHFVLVGDGVEKNDLIKKAEDKKLKNISFMPAIKKEAIPRLCEKYDCIYMGGMDSHIYRFGLCLNKMFDTMASGKPGICALGVESYFTEYNCGYDVKAGDVIEISRTIRKIKRLSEDEKNQMKKAGMKASKNRFNYKRLAEEFISLI